MTQALDDEAGVPLRLYYELKKGGTADAEEANEDEARWDERLKKVVKTKPKPESPNG